MSGLGPFALARRAASTVAAAAGVGVLAAVVGDVVVRVPAATGIEAAPIALRSVLGLVLGVLPVIGLHSQLQPLEETATARLRLVEARYLVALSLLATAIHLLATSARAPAAVAAAEAGSLAGWLGLALVGGRLAGWRLAWALPTAMFVVVAYRGGPPAGPDAGGLLIAAGLLAAGGLAWWLTPWRLRRASPGRRRPRAGGPPAPEYPDKHLTRT